MNNQGDNRFQPSNWQKQCFSFDQSFEDYIAKTRQMIVETRCDLEDSTDQTLILANTPFEYQPENSNTMNKKGILLLHGGLGSPFDMQDLGRYFQKQGFLVRSVLLPGCGTRPGDLLMATKEDWIEVVDYGVQSFSEQVDELYMAGFSLGGALAIRYALLHPEQIKGVITIAPCLSLKTKLSPFISLLHKLQRFFGQNYWVVKGDDNDYVRYDSFPLCFVHEVHRLCLDLKTLRQQHTMQCPLLTVISDADLVIDSQVVERYMNTLDSSNSKLVVYSSDKHRTIKYNGIVRNSDYAEQNILDFSHTSMHIAPDNGHYGIKSDYKDFRHYYHYPKPNDLGERSLYYGSPSLSNLRQYSLANLSYNPDYVFLLEEIKNFTA